MADVGLAMQRALDKTENMKARADAVQELEAAGTFEDLTALGAGEDDIDRQLKQLSSTSEVDAELEKMKAELGGGSARRRVSSERAATPARPGSRARRREQAGPSRGRPRDRPDRHRGAVRARRRATSTASSSSTTRPSRPARPGDEQQFEDAFTRLMEFVRTTASRSPTTSSRPPT